MSISTSGNACKLVIDSELFALAEYTGKTPQESRQMAYILSCLKKWDYKLFSNAAKALKITVDNDIYSAVMKLPFVSAVSGLADCYCINVTAGNFLYNECGEETRKTVIKSVIDYYCGDYRWISEENCLTVSHYAVEYYENEKELHDFFIKYIASTVFSSALNGRKTEIFQPYLNTAKGNRNSIFNKINSILQLTIAFSENNWAAAFESASKAFSLATDIYKDFNSIVRTLHFGMIGSFCDWVMRVSYIDEAETEKYKQKVVELYNAFIEKRKTQLGGDNADVFYDMDLAVGMLIRIEKYHEAENYAEKSYQGIKNINGEKSSKTLCSMSTLSVVYAHTGKFKKAVELAENCLHTAEEILGDGARNIITVLEYKKRLMYAYFYADKDEEAFELFKNYLDSHFSVCQQEEFLYDDEIAFISPISVIRDSGDEYAKILDDSERGKIVKYRLWFVKKAVHFIKYSNWEYAAESYFGIINTQLYQAAIDYYSFFKGKEENDRDIKAYIKSDISFIDEDFLSEDMIELVFEWCLCRLVGKSFTTCEEKQTERVKKIIEELKEKV